jgi:hypothetical protein
VTVVVEENKAYAEVLGNGRAPYLDRLAARYANATAMDAGYPVECPSLPVPARLLDRDAGPMPRHARRIRLPRRRRHDRRRLAGVLDAAGPDVTGLHANHIPTLVVAPTATTLTVGTPLTHCSMLHLSLESLVS